MTRDIYHEDVYQKDTYWLNTQMDISTIRRNRLKQIINERFEGVAATLAQKIDKDPSYISRIFTEKTEHQRKLGENLAREIEEKLGLPKLYLDRLSDEQDEQKDEDFIPSDADYVLIPQYDASATCGKGYLNDYVTVKGGLAFRRDWIKSMGWQSSFLSVLYAVKDSMSPTINNGAIVLVNSLEKEPRSGLLYLISWYGEERIKRIFKDGNTMYRFSSDNQNKAQYPDERVDLSQTPEVLILGRVVWQAGTL